MTPAASGRPPPPRRWSVIPSWVADLNPGAFAFVMATGIVAAALDRPGARPASRVLLAVGVAGYLTLLVAYGWRLLRWRRRFAADLAGPRGFAFLTVVAASNVLASRFVAEHRLAPAAVLFAVGLAGWLLLGYGIPLVMIATAERQPSLDHVNGTWFLWVVGSDSVAVAAAALGRHTGAAPLAVFASICWAIALVQYLLLGATALARLLVRPVRPDDMSPPYWIFMGAAAISVLAGATLLELPPGGGGAPWRPVTAGLSLILWSFCTWLIPLLLGLGVWRHVLQRVPLRYEAGLWSLVFPIGMYGVATRELGRATGMSWLVTIGDDEGWVAAAVWAVVFAAMAIAAARDWRRARHAHSPAAPL